MMDCFELAYECVNLSWHLDDSFCFRIYFFKTANLLNCYH